MQKSSLITNLSHFISTLPGLGARSGMRIAIQLLLNKEKMLHFANLLQEAYHNIKQCNVCGNLCEGELCDICNDKSRDGSIICIVENVADIISIERASFFNGVYHVLYGRLSVSSGAGPDKLNINALIERLKNSDVSEVIIASSSTTEGQTTSFFLMDVLDEVKKDYGKSFKTTTLAKGMPVGSEIDYLDEGTIIASLKSRREV
jgi:recombination protein RecR